MELNELIDGVRSGTYAAILFTQKNCGWCEKMKESIIDLDIPASEVVADSELINTFKLEVTPTLMITSDSDIKRISGFMNPEDLKKSIRDLH